MTNGSKVKVVALFSGGLDSSLAILLMLRQNIEVHAILFMTHFGCDISDRSSCGQNPYPVAEKFGFQVKLCHLGDKFVNIVKNPKYGHGKNMNPCIDCRILMLREAKRYMDANPEVEDALNLQNQLILQNPVLMPSDTLP